MAYPAAVKCTGHSSKTGKPCGNPPVPGAEVCRMHGGAAPQVRARAAVRAEVMRWGLDAPNVDPGETLLKLVSQSAARVELYGRLLSEAYEAAEALRTAHQAGELLLTEDETEDGEPAAVRQAREDLNRIFNTGGVAALVGNTYSASNTGSVYATGEAIRGLAKLESDERERCAGFAAKAITAGLAERQVRIAERQGALIAEMLRAVLGDPELGLSEDQRRAVPAVTRRHLALVAS